MLLREQVGHKGYASRAERNLRAHWPAKCKSLNPGNTHYHLNAVNRNSGAVSGLGPSVVRTYTARAPMLERKLAGRKIAVAWRVTCPTPQLF